MRARGPGTAAGVRPDPPPQGSEAVIQLLIPQKAKIWQKLFAFLSTHILSQIHIFTDF